MAKYEFLRRINLQMFNDGDGDGGQGSGDGAAGDGQGAGGEGNQDPKMVNMTQSDYDKSIQKRLDRGKKAWEKEFYDSDDYKAFQSWQDGQKSEADKLKEQLNGMDALRQSNAEMTLKIQAYEQKELLTKAEVNPEYTDFVMFEVQKSMNDGDDFESALEEFKKAESNAKYFGSQMQQQSFRQGQRHTGKGGSQASTAKSMVSKLYGEK